MEKSEPETFTRGERIRCLILLSLAVILYFFANFQRTVVPGSIFSDLQTELDVSAAWITALGATFMYVYAVCQLFAGVLADRFGGFRVITFAGILFCAGSLIFPFAHTLFLLYLSRIIVGIGASAVYLCMVKETHRAFQGNFGPAMGVAMLIGYMGSMAANAPFIAILRYQHLSWRTGLAVTGGGIVFFMVLFLVFRFSVKMPPVNRNVQFSFKAFLPACTKKHNWCLFTLANISFSIFYAFQTVLGKKFLEDYCSMGSVAAGWVLTVTGGLSAVGSFCVPFLSRFAGNRRKPFLLFMGCGSVLCTMGVLTALLTDFHAAWFFAMLFFLLAVSSNMNPVYLSMLAETNSPEILGICASFSNFMAYMYVGTLGTLSGVLMDLFPPQIVDGVRIYGTKSYIVVFLLFYLLSLIALYSSTRIRETMGKHIDVK